MLTLMYVPCQWFYLAMLSPYRDRVVTGRPPYCRLDLEFLIFCSLLNVPKSGRRVGASVKHSAHMQCCSCLFVFDRTVVHRSQYKRPQFPPKVDFGSPNYRLQASHVASHVDWPSRTLLTTTALLI